MSETVIAVWLGGGGVSHARDEIAAIREAHPAARLILLTTPAGRHALQGFDGTCWEDGAAKGASAFLARARRLSWASAAHIYDLEASRVTRFLRFCVWPRPQWHERAPPGPAGDGTLPLS